METGLAELAVEAEKARVAAEARRIADETAARERNKAHKAKINSAAVQALVSLPMEYEEITEHVAKAIIIAIAQGKIPAVTISY